MGHVIGSVDPYNLDQYRGSTAARQEALLYCLASPGRVAWVTARNLWLLLRLFPHESDGSHLPYESIFSILPAPHRPLAMCGFGNRSQLARAWGYAVFNVDVDDLRHMTVANLVKIPHCGLKTARLIVENLVAPEERHPQDRRIAILDVHVLRWLREHGHPDAPKTTPQNHSVYRIWESVWLDMRDAGLADNDLRLWRSLARRPPDDWKTRPILRGAAAKNEEPVWYEPNGKVVMNPGR